MQGREIKFRAWYETGKRMIDWDEMKDDDELLCVLENKLSDVSPAMQFTGLHDKHGKEIYEGDILDVIRDDGGFYLKVAYDEEFARYWLVDEFGDCYSPEDYGKDEIEVVGNIYENPELLEVGK